MGRVFAVGDIHGCLDAFDGLLDLIRPKSDDLIVTLGDLTDRGPDSRGVLDRVMALTEAGLVYPLKGNHDAMLVAASRGDMRQEQMWLMNGGFKTLESFGGMNAVVPPEYVEFLDGMADFYQGPGWFGVHAYYDPNIPIESPHQDWGRNRWRHLHDPQAHGSGQVAVVGHTAQRSEMPLRLGFLTCIDTACCFGGRLTAMEPATGRFWQVTRDGNPVEEGD